MLSPMVLNQTYSSVICRTSVKILILRQNLYNKTLMSITSNPNITPRTKFSIGEIVSFDTNYIRHDNEFSSVWLSGDQNYVVPLMVVSEIILDSKPKLNLETGKTKSPKNKYKCIWFSNKSLKFEEGSFLEKEIYSISDTIQVKPELTKDNENITKGSKVVFKTNSFEVKKRKSNLEFIGKNKNRKNSSLLTFSSPVFVVVGFLEVQIKEPVIDAHTNTVKRIYSSKLVKVKFFNSLSDKYSEFVVPYEAFKIAETANEIILSDLIKSKKDEIKCLITYQSETILCEVKSIVYVSGEYVIDLINVFTKKEFEGYLSDITHSSLLNEEDRYDPIPSIKKIGDSASFEIMSIESYLKTKNEESETTELSDKIPLGRFAMLLFYKNRYEKFTERYVIPLFLTQVDSKEPLKSKDSEGNETKLIYYLRAYCLLRQDYRFFRVDRMISRSEEHTSE